MRKKRSFLYILLSLSLLILIISLVQNTWLRKKEVVLELLPLVNADMQLGSAHFTQSENGVKKWDLVADDVKYFKGKDQMLLTGLKVSYYFPKQNEPVVIESREGRFDSKSGDIEVFGDVIVISADGDTLSTDILKYSPDSELVTTDEEITLKSGSTIIRGKGLSMDIKNNRVVIKSDVDVTFYNSQLRN